MQTRDPYEAPSVELRTSSPKGPLEEDLIVFLGEGSQHEVFLEKWRKIREQRSNRAGFNWAAAIFGNVWCFYRKLYLLGLGVYAVEFVMGAAAGLVLVLMGGAEDERGALAANVASIIVARIVVGLVANSFFYQRARGVIEWADDHARTPVERRKMIAERGGVSFLGLAAALALNLFFQSVLHGPGLG